jgi:phage shock protein E
MATSLSTPLRQESAEISRAELYQRLGDPSLILLDVLPGEAYKNEHIPGAINLPLAEIPSRAVDVLPDRTHELAVYCASFT